jgi:hypothetical protein
MKEAFFCEQDDRDAEAGAGGVPVAEVIWNAGISEQTFYRRRPALISGRVTSSI